MDKKLEARIARLEKALRVKNEMTTPAQVHLNAVNRALAKAQENMHVLIDYAYAVNGRGVFSYSDEVMNALAQADNCMSQAENILMDIRSEL